MEATTSRVDKIQWPDQVNPRRSLFFSVSKCLAMTALAMSALIFFAFHNPMKLSMPEPFEAGHAHLGVFISMATALCQC